MKKDIIYKKKEEQLRSVIGFISAIDNNLEKKEAFKVVAEAAANFMISHYEKILGDLPESERFEKFREYYEKYPETSPYCEILKSDKQNLEVKFTRCPLQEILKNKKLSRYGRAYCNSDEAFTKALMSNVEFKRTKGMIDGDSYCILTWKNKIT